MLSQTPRALSAVFVITSTIALGACATAGADFEDDANEASDDSGATVGAGGTSAANTVATTATTSTGGTTATTSSTGGMGAGAGGGNPLPTSGENCMDAADLTSAGASLTGNYTDSVADAGSCDPDADNVAWFSYTAAATGLYSFSFTNNSGTPAYSRLAVFEGTSCSPLGNEVACEAAPSQQIDSMLMLDAGVTYTIMFYTDGAAYPMVNPTASITVNSAGPGALCQLADDLTAVAMPYTLTGTFDEDPLSLGSCDTTPTNVVWFKYTAATTDTYLITASNQSTSSWARIAVMEGDSCSPLGAEVACNSVSSSSIETDVDMVANETYIIGFHTDGDTWTMVNPTINVGVKPPPPPGDTCDEAIDVTSATFPYTVTAVYDNDPPTFGGTCDSFADNTAFFTYVPATSGYYQIDGTNASATVSDTRVVVKEGNSCATLGTQVGCMVGSGMSASETSWLEAGQPYIIGIYTPSSTSPLENPTLDIQAVAAPTSGQICEIAGDLSAATFPHALVGEFDDDDYAGSTCDVTPNNAVWYRFTPSVTQAYTISAVNASTTFAYSRMAIFETNGCNPFGTEIDCATKTAKDVALTGVTLTAGTEYLIVFHTDGESYTMIDPQITITP